MIKTERTIWTLLTEADILAVHELESIPEVQRYNTLGIPKNFEATQEIMKPLIEDNKSGANLTFIIRNQANDIIGIFAARKFPERYNAVEVWYKYFPIYWGQGLGTEILGAFIKYGFEEMKLHRIEGGCAVNHVASIRVFEKSGLKKEGRGRKTLPLKSGWSDHFTFAILEEEYFQNQDT